MKNRKIDWPTLLIGLFWIGYTIYIYMQYTNGTLGSFRVPRIIWFVYELIGFIPGVIVQLLVGVLLVWLSFKKVEKNEVEEDNDSEDDDE